MNKDAHQHHEKSPHQRQPLHNAGERFTARVFDALWDRYRERVEYVRDYERVVREAGGTFVNDHVAFRTFACQQPHVGIASVARIFQALGYRAAGTYCFEDKHLDAIHFQHPNAHFPKLFVSEFRTWELEEPARQRIERSVGEHRPAFAASDLALLAQLGREGDGGSTDEDQTDEDQTDALLERTIEWFHSLPWPSPERDDVERLNEASQYAAWVLVHGYHVNHFTALINSHGVQTLDDIEKTAAALTAAGTPMKDDIEGVRGAKLRQTATKAAVIDVAVRQDGRDATMPWTYAYFELAERGDVLDQEGKPQRFEGFLGAQATHLFEMTRRTC